MPKQGFHIINAAAGSGKTYSLVIHYLEQLLASPNKDNYQQMLAMTFTNKAVNEMKERILTVLSHLAAGEPHSMKETLLNSLALSEAELQWRAQTKLRSLLHYYGAFEVTTLDSFTHGVIRTFAFDLGLSHSFEVILDSKPFIHSLVDQLVNQIGVSKPLTQLLTEFSLGKVSDEKSWDISHDLNAFAPILIHENDREPLHAIQSISLAAFQSDRKKLYQQASQLKQEIQNTAQECLHNLQQLGLKEGVFTRNVLVKHFERLAAFTEKSPSKIRTWFEGQLGNQLASGTGFYKKNIDLDQKALITTHTLAWYAAFESTKTQTFQHLFCQALLAQWVPLSLLGVLERALHTQQLDENRMLLGRFNERIAALVKDQPVPFIYERLGTRYQHYFIDEFQDTSVLQWHNLIPLIAHALENQEGSSLLLVGDPKQAIYRWRGGDVQQYVDLLQEQSPFQRTPVIERLVTNYRSYSALVNFNNSFFSFAARHLKTAFHKEMFSTLLQQKTTAKAGGTVAIHRIEALKTKAERSERYAEKVVFLAKELQNEGYQWQDITILVRQKKQAAALIEALHLAEIPALSPDSLLLVQSEKVQWLIQLLQLNITPHDQTAMKIILDGIWKMLSPQGYYHDFLLQYMKKDASTFFKSINENFDKAYDISYHRSLNAYEGLEYICSCFASWIPTDAYTQRLLDVVFDFSKQSSAHLTDFMDYWHREAEQLTIPLPTVTNAIQIMTVHKSKGLEFPVVIYPYLEDDFGPSINDHVWYPLSDTAVSEVPWARLPFSDALAAYSKKGAALHTKQLEMAALDAMNLLYVGFTRAVAQLHLIAPRQQKPSKKATYASVLHDFIEQQGGTDNETYYWSQEKVSLPDPKGTAEKCAVLSHSSLAWRKRLLPERKHNQAARDFGILIHDLLGKIRTDMQVEGAVNQAVQAGKISAAKSVAIQHLLEEVTQHPKIAAAFDESRTVWIEQDLLLPDGQSLRPDRVVIEGRQAIIIDFKTGQAKEQDRVQIAAYGSVIQAMGYHVDQYHLVYMDTPLTIDSFSG